MMTTISVNRTRTLRNKAQRTAPPAASRPATGRETGAGTPSGIPVLPAVDVNLGAVTFFTPTGHHRYFCPEPALLVDSLAAAVRAARWIPEIGTVVVTVAQTGSRAGRGLGFKLEKY